MSTIVVKMTREDWHLNYVRPAINEMQRRYNVIQARRMEYEYAPPRLWLSSLPYFWLGAEAETT